MLLTFRGFSSPFGRPVTGPFCQYVGHLHVTFREEESKQNFDDHTSYALSTIRSMKDQHQRICFSCETVDKLRQRCLSFIVIDLKPKEIIICRKASDPVSKLWMQVFVPMLGSSFVLRDCVFQAVEDWTIAFLFVHLLGADEYRENLSCLKRLTGWFNGKNPNRAKEMIQASMLVHLKTIRDRYFASKKEQQGKERTEERKEKKLHQRWQEQFSFIAKKLVDEHPLYSHTSHALLALMTLYQNSE